MGCSQTVILGLTEGDRKAAAYQKREDDNRDKSIHVAGIAALPETVAVLQTTCFGRSHKCFAELSFAKIHN